MNDLNNSNDNAEDYNDKIKYDEDGNPISDENNQEIEEPEDPIPEISNPLNFDKISEYLYNLTKTYSGMSYAFSTFNCSEKEIDNIDENNISKFKHIRDVNISKNKLYEIKGFNNMKHLFRFNAQENEIRDMNVFSDCNSFKFLQLLYLSNNKIKVLPELFCDNLLELHLDNNLIKNTQAFELGLKKELNL